MHAKGVKGRIIRNEVPGAANSTKSRSASVAPRASMSALDSVVGLYDELAEQGRIIRKEQDGVRVLVDLKKGDKTHAIQAIKDVLSQLEE